MSDADDHVTRGRGRSPWAWVRRLLLLVVLLGVLLVTYQATRTFLALRAAQGDVASLQAQLREDRVDAARATGRDLARQARTAHRHTDNLLWDGLAAVPVVGDNVDAVQRLSAGLDQVGRAVPDALVVYGRLGEGRLRSADGRLDLAAIGRLRPRLGAVATRLSAAARLTAPIRPDDLLPGLSGQARKAAADLDEAATFAKASTTAVRLLPTMLGGPSARTYLLVAQNNAEIRATGGLPGSLSLLQAQDGRITLGAQLTVSTFGLLDRPVGPQPADERAVYGADPVSDIRDFTLVPDWPTDAGRFATLVRRTLGRDVDGVLSVDPVTLAAVLRATGPVSGPGGEQLTGDNALEKLLHEPYQRFARNDRQNLYFAATARAVFTRFTRGQLTSGLFSTLAEAVSQRRVMVWSAHPDEQEQLAGTAVAGELPTGAGRSPQVGLYLNDAAAGKMEYYLRSSTSLASRGCAGGRQQLRATMTLSSRAPQDVSGLSTWVRSYPDLAPAGAMRLRLHVYAPSGGAVTEVTANGEVVPTRPVSHRGRPVVTVSMLLRAGQQVRLSADLEGAPQASGDPRLEWTPGMTWAPTRRTAPSACS